MNAVDAYRALELLEAYHSRLNQPQDRQLRAAMERVILIFKSRLFQALIGIPNYNAFYCLMAVGYPSLDLTIATNALNAVYGLYTLWGRKRHTFLQ